MPATYNAGAIFAAGAVVYPASVKGIWVTCHNSLTAAASSTANLATPGNAADTNAIWIRVPDNCTRAQVRGRCDVGISAVGGNPAVYCYAIYTANEIANGAAVPSDVKSIRVDADTLGGTATTLTFGTAGANTQIRDATYLYTNPSSTFDLRGAAYFLLLVQTAGSGLTGAGTPTAEVCFLN
jgi:hypothetical protein